MEKNSITLAQAQKEVDDWIKKYGVRYFNELTNVLWVLICIANQTEIDLTEQFRKNIEKKTARDNERHINNNKLKA